MVHFDPTLSSCPLWRHMVPLPNSSDKSRCGVEGCNSLAPLTCGGCHGLSYCGKDHQKQHWQSGHKKQCAPFKIVKKPGVGRYLVATRDIEPGEVILTESPITAGPKQYTSPVCLGCNRAATLTGYRCTSCDGPMCDEKCEKATIHKLECKILSAASIKPTQLKQKNTDKEKKDAKEETKMNIEPEPEHPMYKCITPLRVCLVQILKPDNWKVVNVMETHRGRREMDENGIHNKHNIVNFLLQHAKLGDHIEGVTEEHIIKSNDVLDVNAFEIRCPDGSMRGLYPLTAMMNSSCSPNTQNSIDSDWVCRVRAARMIRRGEEICDTYTTTLTNTQSRRTHLKTTKYFDCCCQRCSDPTELGSHFSTLICRSGGCGAYMLSTDPLAHSADWRCLKCGFQLEGDMVVQEQKNWEQWVESSSDDLEEQRKLLTKLCSLYHPNHNMMMDVKFNMVHLLGQDKNKDLVKEAEEKKDICENILGMMDYVIPGMFRMRGMFLVELFSTKQFLLRSLLEMNSIQKPVFVNRLAKLRKLLVEAKTILKFEPLGSIENYRLESVKKYLSQLDHVVGSAGAKLVT